MEYRTAFITGASSGIGRALAVRLARAGVEVALAARRQQALAEVAAEIAEAGGRSRVFAVDVADADATLAAVQRADDELQGLDLVVANAGVGAERWAGKMRWQDVKPHVDVNVAGAAATLIAVLPRMVERKRGHLVGVSSLAGSRALPKQAAYCAAKAFLSTFLEGLRLDLRGTGVAVTDVQPGFVRTPMTAGNKFHMPFLKEPDEAAAIIEQGIEERAPVVAFPWPLVAAVRTARLIPTGIYGRAVGRARRR